MSNFFAGFTDEILKLAEDPFGELDTYMKQKGIKTPKSFQSKKQKIKPIAPPKPAQPSAEPEMKVRHVAPGSAEAKRIGQMAKTQPKMPSAGELARQEARARHKRMQEIRKQQQEPRY